MSSSHPNRNTMRRRLRAGVLAASLQALAITASLPRHSVAALQTPEKRFDLTVSRGDVEDLIKVISSQTGRNVLLLSSVRGNVTLTLKQVTAEEALRKIAAALGSEVRRVDDTFYVGSVEEIRQLITRTGIRATLTLNYLKPEDAVEILKSAFPFVSSSPLGKTTLVTVAGAPEDVEAAVARLKSLDLKPAEPPVVPPMPPKIERQTRVLSIVKADIAIETLRKAVPGLTVSAVEQALVLEGTPDILAQAKAVLDTIDLAGATQRIIKLYNLKYLHPHQAASTLGRFYPELAIQAGTESLVPTRASFRPLGIETERAFSQQGLQGGSSGNTALLGGGSAGGGTTPNGGGAGGAGSGAGPGGAAGAAGGAGGGQTGLSLDSPGSRSRVLILAGPAGDIEAALKLLGQLDVKPPQVLIEARVVDLSPSRLRELGFKWDPQRFGLLENNGEKAPLSIGGYSRTPFNIGIDLDAQDTVTEFKVLARPNVTVVDGEEASIFIGDIIRFERLSSVSDTGNQIFTIESVPVGVALLCRPRVNEENGHITLRIHPVVSSVTAFTGRNNDIPQTATREAESTLVVKDGETIALGGLLREQDIRTMTSIPYLSRIPFFGELFKHRRVEKRKSEVTIFMTVKMAKD